MINSLSTELDILRPSLLETGLESVGYNLNRKNSQLRFFEFGKTYSTGGIGDYVESNHLSLWLTGELREDSWKEKGRPMDIFFAKGVCEGIFQLLRIECPEWKPLNHPKLINGLRLEKDGRTLAEIGAAAAGLLKLFDCRQDVYFIDLRWDVAMELAGDDDIVFTELPRQLPVYRDLAMVVDKTLPFEKVRKAIFGVRLDKLQEVKLFDIFESEKLGEDKKSLAMSFTFLDEEKTLTDTEIDAMVHRIIGALEREVHAEIRK